MKLRFVSVLVVGWILGLTAPGFANDLLATEQFSGTAIALRPQQSYANLTLRVIGPDEFEASASFPNGTPSLDLSRFGKVADGLYDYHLVGTTGAVVVASRRDDGRSPKDTSTVILKTVSKGGSFTVRGGVIVTTTETEPRRGK